MKTSVLMTVYYKEQPEFLKLALESIYDNQTKKPDEIVVVFDGKLTDGLYKVLDEFKQGKEDIVFYYPQEENRGSGEASRIGVEKCTGDYIFRMDSDDISHPQRIEKQLAYLEAHPDVDVLGTNMEEFYYSLDENKRAKIYPEEHKALVKMAKMRNPVCHSSSCFKKKALEKCGGYETMLLMEDYFVCLKIIASGGKLANLNETLLYARIGNGFYERRNAKVRISSCIKLQKYMLKNKLINIFEAFINVFILVGFTFCPIGIRKFVYNKVLRKGAIE